MVNCPQCDAAIDVDEDELDEGDAITCEECGANLNVTGVSPLEFTADKDAVDDDDGDLGDDDDFDEDYEEDDDEDEEEEADSEE
jgi:alpha-aminoadipate carrier protein LysW